LRYEVAEQNRWLTQSWETMQILLGCLFFGYLLFGTTEGKFSLLVLLLMLVLTLLQRFLLSPELGLLGRSLDYLPSDVVNQERAKFWLIHNTYLAMEAAKYGLGLILGAIVLRRGRSVDPLNQFDMIDKANHRHVNW